MTEARDQTYIFDTNVFNHVLKGEIPAESFAGYRLFVTRIQRDELESTTTVKIREDLLTLFEDIAPISWLASSFAFDIEGAGFGQAYWNDGSGNFDEMLAMLKKLDRKKKKHCNQLRDILIAETAIKNGQRWLAAIPICAK